MQSKWWQKAKCKGYIEPEIFFAADREMNLQKQAKAICRECPVRRDCLEETLVFEETHYSKDGIFGGMTLNERNMLSTLLRASGVSLDVYMNTLQKKPVHTIHIDFHLWSIPKSEQLPVVPVRRFQLVRSGALGY